MGSPFEGLSRDELLDKLAANEVVLMEFRANEQAVREASAQIRIELARTQPPDLGGLFDLLPGKEVSGVGLKPMDLAKRWPAALVVTFKDGSTLAAWVMGGIDVHDSITRTTRRPGF